MAKKQTTTTALQSIDLHTLDQVTGGRGSGSLAALRQKQLSQAQTMETTPWSNIGLPTAQPFASTGQSNGTAGTAGTPGAFVHNGKFRPL